MADRGQLGGQALPAANQGLEQHRFQHGCLLKVEISLLTSLPINRLIHCQLNGLISGLIRQLISGLASLRFGLSRFTTEGEVDDAADRITVGVARLWAL